MSKSRYRWVIVAAGGLLGCVAIGAMFSLPVFLRPIARDTGWSITGVSSARRLGSFAMAFASMFGKPVGPLRSAPDRTDRIRRLGHCSGGGEPGHFAHRVSIDLRLGGRRRDGGYICAHDGLRDRVVRYTSQPGGVPRFRRHGNGANHQRRCWSRSSFPTTIGERPSKSSPRWPQSS